MSSDATEHDVTQEASGAPGAVGTAFAIFAAFVGAAAAGAASYYLPGTIGVAGATGFALGGALSAIYFARSASGAAEARAQILLDLTGRGDDPAVLGAAPESFRGVWKALYKRIADLAVQARASGSALLEMERLHGQIEAAAIHFRDGNDPLVEEAELRAGPLREFLEAARDSHRGPPAERPTPKEVDLIGADSGVGLSSDGAPAATLHEPVLQEVGTPPDPEPEALRVGAPSTDGANGAILDELIADLEQLHRFLAAAETAPERSESSHPLRTPAQLVDALVSTAANGIEDLAAGLMRANELASVAERVTNRATLLALNAALEATRSGSEAFASIAEETRRLAEFAREATDTIARLAEEIEVKVGETITAIHVTSEDAKTAVASLGGVTGQPAEWTEIRDVLGELIARARSLRHGRPTPMATVSNDMD